jgi:hypothetical protein
MGVHPPCCTEEEDFSLEAEIKAAGRKGIERCNIIE